MFFFFYWHNFTQSSFICNAFTKNKLIVIYMNYDALKEIQIIRVVFFHSATCFADSTITCINTFLWICTSITEHKNDSKFDQEKFKEKSAWRTLILEITLAFRSGFIDLKKPGKHVTFSAWHSTRSLIYNF